MGNLPLILRHQAWTKRGHFSRAFRAVRPSGACQRTLGEVCTLLARSEADHCQVDHTSYPIVPYTIHHAVGRISVKRRAYVDTKEHSSPQACRVPWPSGLPYTHGIIDPFGVDRTAGGVRTDQIVGSGAGSSNNRRARSTCTPDLLPWSTEPKVHDTAWDTEH